MPIEFRCTNCNKLLRTKDDTAGKQAKCPECGTVLQIPMTSTAAPEVTSEVPLPPQDFRFAPTSPGTPANPFASPQYGGAAAVAPDSTGRIGPPWERDGQSAASYVETVKQVITNPQQTFAEMRREGGLLKPYLYALVGSFVAAVAGAVYSLLLPNIYQNAAPGFGQGNAVPAFAMGGLQMACVIVLVPLWVGIGSFIASGLYHLILMMVGGARHGFETTYRVACYSYGSTTLFNLIPIVGGIVALVAQVVYATIGFSKAHEISIGKGLLAALLPILLCCLGCIGLGVIFAGVFAAAAHNANF